MCRISLNCKSKDKKGIFYHNIPILKSHKHLNFFELFLSHFASTFSLVVFFKLFLYYSDRFLNLLSLNLKSLFGC